MVLIAVNPSAMIYKWLKVYLFYTLFDLSLVLGEPAVQDL